MSAADSLRAEAARRILVKDGAYGTMVQAQKLSADSYCAGLDLMRERVTELGGSVDVVSAPARGTTVRVRIPAGAS